MSGYKPEQACKNMVAGIVGYERRNKGHLEGGTELHRDDKSIKRGKRFKKIEAKSDRY